MAEGVIYGLVDPLTLELRYVGQSLNHKRRFRRHLHSALDPKSHVHAWIAKLRHNGFQPILVILAHHVPSLCLNVEEQFFVAYHRGQGCNLTNLTDGGSGVSGYTWTDEAKERQSTVMKGVWNDPKKSQRIGNAQREAVSRSEWRARNALAQRLVQKKAQSDPELNHRRGLSISRAILARKIQVHRWQDDGGK